MYQSHKLFFATVLFFVISFSSNLSLSPIDRLISSKCFSNSKIEFLFLKNCLSTSSWYVWFYSLDVSNDSSIHIVEKKIFFKVFEKKITFSQKSVKNVTFKVIQVILSDLKWFSSDFEHFIKILRFNDLYKS